MLLHFIFNIQSLIVKIGHPYPLEIAMGHRFKPDCLPDTRSPGIEDSFGSLLPILLPSGHFQIQGVIFRLYHNLVFPILYKVRYLHTKANVSLM